MIKIETRTKACGIDIHKRILYVTIMDRIGNITTKEFPNSISGFCNIYKWLLEEACNVVAFESTSIYWRSLYTFLYHEDITIEVANAYFIKNIPGKKTDVADSQWIAELALNRLIRPSRVLIGDDKDLRDLTRGRETQIKERTIAKNIVHKILDEAQITLSKVLSDIFGKGGLVILTALANGTPITTILDNLPSRLKSKRAEIEMALQNAISPDQLYLLKSNVELIKFLTIEIDNLTNRILEKISNIRIDDFKIVSSIPGIGNIGASVILAEIGPIKHFQTPDQLVSYAGLNPTIYQSAGTTRIGHISRRGTHHLRWILVECAQACVRHKGTAIYEFYLRIKEKSGFKKAIVAVARKLLTLVWHLLTKHEMYEDKGYDKKGNVSIPGFKKLALKLGFNEAFQCLKEAFLIDKANESELLKMVNSWSQEG